VYKIITPWSALETLKPCSRRQCTFAGISYTHVTYQTWHCVPQA
jgi:hypothetical protein